MRQTIMKRCAPVVVALLLAACSGTPDATISPTPSQAPTRIASTGHLSFVTPTQGAQVPADHVEVRLLLTGATLTKVVSTDIKPDIGHVHLQVDGRTVSILAGLDEILNDVVDVATGKKLGPLSKGSHILKALFVASDHGPFNPVVETFVTITAV